MKNRIGRAIAVSLLLIAGVWCSMCHVFALKTSEPGTTGEPSTSAVVPTRPESAYDEASVAALLSSLARSDPAAAAEIVAELPPGDFQQVAVGQVATAWARVEPGCAFAWAQTVADDKARLRAVREVAMVWAESDPISAAGAIAQLETEQERQLGALAVATAWTRKDPRSALVWAVALEAPGARALVAGSAVQTWADGDAASAMEWLTQQPIGFQASIDPLTTRAILAQWARQAPADVRDFVEKMPPDVGQIRAAEAVALHLAKNDPLSTLAWALGLSHPPAREIAFSKAFRQWRDDFPQPAQAWLSAADLTTEEKRRLLGFP